MKSVTEITIINTPPEPVFEFLTSVDRLYKLWHPRDHVFFRMLKGNLKQEGSICHFLEILGWFPLYLPMRITKVVPHQYIEYKPLFPLSLLNAGYGYFKIESTEANISKLTAYAEWGWKTPFFGKVLDMLSEVLIPYKVTMKHIREEGQNLKSYAENQATFETVKAK